MKNWSLFVIIFGIVVLSAGIFTAQLFAIGLHAPLSLYRILLILGIIFPLSFLLSSLFDHSKKQKDGSFYYPVINTIAGIMLYFFLSAILLSLILVVYTILGKTMPPVYAQCFAVASAVFGVLGIIQAQHIHVVKYSAHLPTAPIDWNNKTAVLVSDTHFGLINHKTFSDKLVKHILTLAPDFVLHAGDFYDGPKNNMAPITESWKALTEKIPVFYTPGNHEHYGDYKGFMASIRDANITILEDAFVEYDGVQIAGIVYRAKNQNSAAHEALVSLKTNPATPLILINHPPTFHDSANHINANLMVSGHTHNGQFWPNNFVTGLIYKQFNYGLQKTQNVVAITTSGVGTAGPPMRLFNTPELVLIRFTTNS